MLSKHTFIYIKKKSSYIFIIAILTTFLISPLQNSWPHPHVTIYNSVIIVFDQKGLAGFTIKWQFDEMFSNMMLLDYDKNKNKSFEPNEVKTIKTKAFSNLKNFDYFTHLKINDKKFQVKYVTEFSASFKNNKLLYQFFVPCNVRALNSYKTIKLAVYDQSFYCSVFLNDNPVSFENKDPYQVDYNIRENKEEAYYYGQIYPEEITFKFRLK